ncbi:probable basic-leucine zipper transcription factor L [Littorina saxatilis]|uniref:probable basic-leucine zipper transcription factor L n=1 Tax=Littorina saxatilis TaxID=31220 RepID=UPI0038B42E1F
MITAKPPTALPGSVGIHLPAFKRKRIEQWCEDVAQYLKAGSLCRSVIGHIIEDNRLAGSNGGVKSAPTGSKQRTTTTTTTTTSAAAAAAAASATSISTVTEMLSLSSNKKENSSGGGGGGGVNANVVSNNNNNNTKNACIQVTKIDTTAPPSGRGTPMPDASGPLPVVKFTYNTYNEQRRRIDRLVQGLPVLSASATPNPGSALERLAGTNSAAVVYANGGEEPLRSGSPSRGISPAPDPRSASRSSSVEHRQPSRNPNPRPVNLSRQQSISPTPSRPHNHNHHHHPSNSSSHHHNHHHNKVSSEIVVIKHDYHPPGHHNTSNDFHTGFRSLNFDGNPMLKRSQSQKVYKARQRILASTRRS